MTYLEEAGSKVEVDGRTVLDPASPVVWFTFPGAHHDIGRFHTPAGELTGFYADILTPVERRAAGDGPEVWRTTDLFLDVFVTPDGEASLLDQKELNAAVARGWVEPEQAAAAEAEAARLLHEAAAGRWPPAVVRAWTLDRAAAVAGTPGRRAGYGETTSNGDAEDG